MSVQHVLVEWNSPDAYAMSVSGWVGDGWSLRHRGSAMMTHMTAPDKCDPVLYHVWLWTTDGFEDFRPEGIVCQCGAVKAPRPKQ